MPSKKRNMILDKIDPALLVFIAAIVSAVITGGAIYNYQSRQSRSGAATRERVDSAVNLMEKLATQTGNKEVLQDVIEARTKLLSADRPPDDATIKSILAGVPRLTEEYKKLEANKATAAEQLLAEFRGNWEPLIRFLVSEFDRRTDELIAEGLKVNVQKDEAFKVAGIGQEGGSNQWVRTVERNGIALRLYLSTAQIRPSSVSGAALGVLVRYADTEENTSNPLNISFHAKEAMLGDHRIVPADAGRALAFRQAAATGMNKAFQDFMVLSNAQDH
jgi:hypothetical protein